MASHPTRRTTDHPGNRLSDAKMTVGCLYIYNSQLFWTCPFETHCISLVFILFKVAKQLGPGHTIVTCLCDTGSRYYAKLFSREFLKSKGKPRQQIDDC